MWLTSRLQPYLVCAKYCLPFRAQTFRQLCVTSVRCSTQLADQHVNVKPQILQNANPLCWYDKWPGENKTTVARAFQRLKYMRLIKAAVRVGTPYPEQNPHLASLIEEVKKFDSTIPIEQVIETTLNPKIRSGIWEVAGPCGVLFILQHDSVDLSLTEYRIKEVCENYDLTFLGPQRRSLLFFDQKGILTALSHQISLEEALAMATKAGAESVSTNSDAEKKTSFEIYCNPSDLHKVKRQLESSFVIEEAFVGYIPKSPVKVPDSLKLKMADAIIGFSKVPVIEMIYENVK